MSNPEIKLDKLILVNIISLVTIVNYPIDKYK